MINEVEIWKPVTFFDLQDYYEVSNKGRVRSLDRVTNNRPFKGRVLKKEQNRGGYLTCRASMDGRTYAVAPHRAVATEFLKNEQNYPEVNHKDGNKLNNSADNLEWCTRSYNVTHSYTNKLLIPLFGSKNHKSKLTEDIVRQIISEKAAGTFKMKDWRKRLNVQSNTINKIFRGEAWKHVTNL
jgi:hypothetical protein